MTTLPAPKGYKNRGKSVSRHLSDAEKRTIALFASRNNTAKACTKFGVSAASVQTYIREFGFAFPKRKSNW